ncbi:hypothetical protein D3C76_1294230 [compost metagenome]
MGSDAEQRQSLDQRGLGADAGELTLHVTGQFATTAADQFVAGQRELAQVLRGGQQWCQVSRRLGCIGAGGVLAELFQARAQFALGL